MSEPIAEAPLSHNAEQHDELSAGELRRYIRNAPLSRQTVGFSSLFGEIYTTVFGIVVLLVAAYSLIANIRSSYLSDHAGSANQLVRQLDPLVPGQLAWAVVLLAAFAGSTLLVSRLGPAHLDTPHTQWLLPLPVSRRALLRPAVLRSAGIMTAVGAAAGAALAILESPELSIAAMALTMASTAGLFLLGFGLAQLGQNQSVGKLLGQLALGLLAVLAALGLAATLGLPVLGSWLLFLPSSWPVLASAGQLWPALLLAVAIVLLVLVLFGLPRILTKSLREHSARASLVRNSIVSMDSASLASSLGGAESTGERRSRRKFVLASEPAAVLLRADALRYLRHPGRLVWIAALAVLPAVGRAFIGGSSSWPIVVLLLLCGLLATAAASNPLKLNALNPILDELLPLAPGTVRKLHAVVPATLLTGWAALSFGLLWLTGAGSLTLFIAGVVAGPALAGGALRGAFKKPADWSQPAIATPSGALPAGVAAQLLAGPDLAAIVLAPTIISLIAGAAADLLLPIQVALSAIVLLVVTRDRKSSK
ncbi:DUF6297 family protein [Psychromicrobium lacuslunae]|uniref:Uncharacterized protein n=1 Tax=Psychromicrobium lacuslunae TaxID=1618207 RepID=A0A0D4C1G8_9MICC|nr:DUF6297 family protein [Psychromicrobium lacuslunae]AJT42502.1 hypothetical protein UM93_15190 [Psychromicrobium lacuslunae]